MRNEIVQSYESFRYCELYYVIEWKNNCVYRTKSLGFIKAEHENLLTECSRNFITSSISTNLTRSIEFEIPVFTAEEISMLIADEKCKGKEAKNE